MRELYRIWCFLAILGLSGNVYGEDVLVESAWARATAPGQDVAAVDLTITSRQSASLIGVSSEVCRAIELHSMSEEAGIMKMREVKSVELPAGKPVNLAQQGYHLMLVGLKTPLKVGERVPLILTIRFSDNRRVNVGASADVRPINSGRAASREHMHME